MHVVLAYVNGQCYQEGILQIEKMVNEFCFLPSKEGSGNFKNYINKACKVNIPYDDLEWGIL